MYIYIYTYIHIYIYIYIFIYDKIEIEALRTVRTACKMQKCSRSSKAINREWCLGPNLPKKFWGRNFENLTPDSESVLPRHHVSQF